MQDPELYAKVNSMQRRDVKETLDKFPFGWKRPSARIMDVGCGDGSVTMEVWKKYIPESFSELIGSDISRYCVEFAQKQYGNKKIKFIRLDIEDDLPNELKGKFDHVISSYAMHWVLQQRTAFSNIYDMLVEGGSCLLIFLGQCRVFDVFDELSRMPRWSTDLKHVRTKFISPYFLSQDPESEIRNILKPIGFKDVVVKAISKTSTYAGGKKEFRLLMKSINPFDGLKANWDDFMDDYAELEPNAETCRYQLIIVYGVK